MMGFGLKGSNYLQREILNPKMLCWRLKVRDVADNGVTKGLSRVDVGFPLVVSWSAIYLP